MTNEEKDRKMKNNDDNHDHNHDEEKEGGWAGEGDENNGLNSWISFWQFE